MNQAQYTRVATINMNAFSTFHNSLYEDDRNSRRPQRPAMNETLAASRSSSKGRRVNKASTVSAPESPKGSATVPTKTNSNLSKGAVMTTTVPPPAPPLTSAPPSGQNSPYVPPVGTTTSTAPMQSAASGPKVVGPKVPSSSSTGPFPSSNMSSATSSGISSTAGVPASMLSAAAGVVQQQRSDRLVAFLATLVTYPFMFLLTKRAAAVSVSQMAGVSGGMGIDTRKRLADFPEGAALLELESWCREPVFTHWVYEWTTRLLVFMRQLLITYAPYPIVVQVLHHPWVLKTLQIPTQRSLQQLVTDYMPRAEQHMAQGMPHVALRDLQPLVEPSLVTLKSRLEERVKLSRGPTLLERTDFFTTVARGASKLFFTWLRGLARLCTYVSSLLSVISGALSFTVVPSIILSVISAMLGVAQLLLMGTADVLEPAVNGVLALTDTGKDTAAALGGTPESTPVSVRVLPASTVEQLEPFFNMQLKQESGLLNRPEIPHLAGLNRPLLVKAYDLGLIDAKGRTETRVVAEMLAAAEAQSVSHVLLRGLSRAAIAATSFDVPALLAVLQQTGEGVYSSLLPAFLGGNKASLRQLFRPDGFFAYADDRQAQVATVLLARLLSWLHLSQVVCPGSPDCLRYVLVLGERQAGKASLFTRLVAAPAEYAGQLGGTGAEGPLDGTTGMGAEAKATALSSTSPSADSSTRSKSSPTSGAGPALAPAVDMQQLAGQPNSYVVCVPGLHSADEDTRKMAQRLAGTLGGLSSAVVFLVHPSSDPSPSKLQLLIPPLAAGCHCLVAINGPSRVEGLITAATGLNTRGPASTLTGLPHTPLESLRARWQSAAEALCAQHGLNPSLLGVIVSEVVDSEGELPAGVQHFKQVQDWVVTNAAQAHRMV